MHDFRKLPGASEKKIKKKEKPMKFAYTNIYMYLKS